MDAQVVLYRCIRQLLLNDFLAMYNIFCVSVKMFALSRVGAPGCFIVGLFAFYKLFFCGFRCGRLNWRAESICI